jgi:hypothetical protein
MRRASISLGYSGFGMGKVFHSTLKLALTACFAWILYRQMQTIELTAIELQTAYESQILSGLSIDEAIRPSI